jgi:hypothetical protein
MVTAPSSISSALLLRGEQTTVEDQNLARLLDFFGISWKAVTARDESLEDVQGKYVVVSSADCMADAIRDAQSLGERLPAWVLKASTIYIYGFQDGDRSTKLLRFLTGDPEANVTPIHTQETTVTITADAPEMCGPMSGLRVPITLRSTGCVCEIGPVGEGFQSVVRANEGEVFFAVTCAGVRFYLNTWGGTLDIDALSVDYFDVKKHFCEAVPLTFYLKWAFPDATNSLREINACLIVDDPPLKRRYGFMDFREALDLMKRHNFTTTIAFIPWNWRRTHRSTLKLFQSYPERFSVVVHGCDHTAGEFAERSPALLNLKIQTSRKRMERFRRRASIKADSVMVFPQGQFSPETGPALKFNDFVAAVNTEVAPSRGAANATTIADLWNIAIMKYGTFPIFTRRYLNHGIENFAFDALLGKPCLIAAHHDVFKDHARDMVDLIDRLNALRWNLVWRPLGEALRRTFTIRRVADGTNVIQMFANNLVVDNPDAEACRTLLQKEEGDPERVEAVLINQKAVQFSVDGGHLRFWLTTLPGERSDVRVVYRNNSEALPHRAGAGANIKVAVKRYLSEFRDNYLSRNEFLYQSALALKHLMK